MPVEHFASKAKYLRNLAYRHIHGIPMTASKVCIQGKCHEVDHKDSSPARKRIDEKQRKKVERRGTRLKARGSFDSRRSGTKHSKRKRDRGK